MLNSPIGISFSLKRDWKALFRKDAFFMYQRKLDSDLYVLRRFTIFNVIKFYFFRMVVALLSVCMRPLALMAWHFWYNTEGEDFISLTGATFYMKNFNDLPKFFNLDKSTNTQPKEEEWIH